METTEPTIEETNVLLWKKLHIAIEVLQRIRNEAHHMHHDGCLKNLTGKKNCDCLVKEVESAFIRIDALEPPRQLTPSDMEESIKIGSEAFKHIPDAVDHIRKKRGGY